MSGQIKDYLYLRDIRAIKGISSSNAECLEEWKYRQRADGCQLSSINADVGRMVMWIRLFGCKDVRDVTHTDVIMAYNRLLDRVAAKDYSESTLDGDVIAIRKFYKWLLGPEEGAKLVDIKRKKHPNTRTLDEYITREQVIAMRNYAESKGDVRGVAMIMLFYGTGARRGELHAANVRDVKIYKTHAVINLDGKTGLRQTPFVVSLPEIQAWINRHPCRLSDGTVDPDAPLFCTYNTRGHGIVRLSKSRITSYIRSVATAVGVPKEVKASPHAMRHLSASENARGLTSAEMEAYYGWSKGSQTVATYVHTSEDQLRETILRQNDIVTPTKAENKSLVTQCPRCSTINPSGAKYCSGCSLILDNDLNSLFGDIVSDMCDPDILRTLVGHKSDRNNSQNHD